MKPIQGKKILLKPATLHHLPHFWKWIQDKKVIRYMTGAQFPKTYKDEMRWFRSVKRKKDELLLVILDAATLSPIGSLGVHQISRENRKALIGIMIGEKSYWHKGYGTDAMNAALQFCFKKLKLNKLSLTVDVEHKAGIRCYKKCGFQKVGYLKDDAVRNGAMCDSYLMEVFAADYKRRYKS